MWTGATCLYTQGTWVLDLLVLVVGWGSRVVVGSWGGVGGEGGIPFGCRLAQRHQGDVRIDNGALVGILVMPWYRGMRVGGSWWRLGFGVGCLPGLGTRTV